MSTATIRSESYSHEPQLEPWQFPVGQQSVPLYCKLPLAQHRPLLELAVEDDVAMVNDQAATISQAEQHVLSVLLRNQHRDLSIEHIYCVADDNGLKLSREQITDYIGELAAKLRVGNQRFMGRIAGAKNEGWLYRIKSNVVYTGSVKESEHAPVLPVLPEAPDISWHEGKACAGAPAQEIASKKDIEAELAAVARYCAKCVVTHSCLTDGLLQEDSYGVRGGTTSERRGVMIRARRAQRDGYYAALSLQILAGRDTGMANVIPLHPDL